MLSPDIAQTKNLYLESLDLLGLGPESIAIQSDEVDRFLANPPLGMETSPEEHFKQTVLAVIDELTEPKFS